MRLPSFLAIIALAALAPTASAQNPAPKETDSRLQADGKSWRLDKAKVVDPKQPRILLMGDSILNGYLPSVAKALDGVAYVDAWVTPTSQGDKSLPKQIEEVCAQGPYDIIHFNL